MNKFNNISEEDLVKGCLADKRDYQEKLYRLYADKMYAVCLMYTKNEDEACDVLQNGFIKVFKKLNKFRFEASLGGWIRKVMVNEALDHYRKKKREQEVMEDFKGRTFNIVETALEKINAAELVRLVNELPEKAAMVLKLYAIEGYAHQEIAELMNISTGTSKSQLNRARSLLKEKLDRLNG